MRKCSTVVNLSFNSKFGSQCSLCDLTKGGCLKLLLTIHVNLEHIFNITCLSKQLAPIKGAYKSWNSHYRERTKVIKEHMIALLNCINVWLIERYIWLYISLNEQFLLSYWDLYFSILEDRNLLFDKSKIVFM